MKRKASKTEVVVVGAGGHGSEVFSYFTDLTEAGGDGRFLGFFDDKPPLGVWSRLQLLGPLPALQKFAQLRKRRALHYITAFGNNGLRHKVVKALEAFGLPQLQPWTLRHPSAQVGLGAEIGAGTLLAPGVILTSRVRIGGHCIINVKASVSHDCNVADFVNINPGAILCGNVTVGEGAFIGAGAVIKEKITLGRGVIVGAGAVVIRDLPDNAVAVGVPARVIKNNPAPWLEP